MVAFLLSLATKLLGWLATVLPVSPFANLALDGAATALGWLNWVVPVGQMATLFAAWLACVVVWQVVNFVSTRWTSVLSMVGGTK